MKLRPTYRIMREIESEIVKCSEIETALALRESELTKRLYVSHFEINGFAIVTGIATLIFGGKKKKNS